MNVKTVISSTGDLGYLEPESRRVFRVIPNHPSHLEWCYEDAFHSEGNRARWYGFNPEVATMADLVVG